MDPVKRGDVITIDDKRYLFTKGSALVFNTALAIKKNSDEWPEDAVISITIHTRAGEGYKKHYPFPLEKVVKAVKQLQTREGLDHN